MTTRRTWFDFKASTAALGSFAEAVPVYLYDDIGSWGVTVSDFAAQMNAISPTAEIELHINSNGGDVFAGNAIYNIILRRTTKVTAYIDGIAASMASLIAMAAKVVVMPGNAMMMIHDPVGGVLGRAKEMRETAQVLDTLRDGMVRAYAKKTGLKDSRILELMDAETWLTADEAVAMGFADRVEDPIVVSASADLSRFKTRPIARSNQEDTTMTKEQIDALKSEITTLVAQTVKDTMKAVTDAETAALAVAAAKPADGAQPDAATLAANATATAQANTKQIASLCALAGLPDKAAGFIAEGKTPAEVMALLATAKAAKDAGEISARSPGGGGGAGGQGKAPATVDTNGVYARWNKPGKAA